MTTSQDTERSGGVSTKDKIKGVSEVLHGIGENIRGRVIDVLDKPQGGGHPATEQGRQEVERGFARLRGQNPDNIAQGGDGSAAGVNKPPHSNAPMAGALGANNQGGPNNAAVNSVGGPSQQPPGQQGPPQQAAGQNPGDYFGQRDYDQGGFEKRGPYDPQGHQLGSAPYPGQDSSGNITAPAGAVQGVANEPPKFGTQGGPTEPREVEGQGFNNQYSSRFGGNNQGDGQQGFRPAPDSGLEPDYGGGKSSFGPDDNYSTSPNHVDQSVNGQTEGQENLGHANDASSGDQQVYGQQIYSQGESGQGGYHPELAPRSQNVDTFEQPHQQGDGGFNKSGPPVDASQRNYQGSNDEQSHTPSMNSQPVEAPQGGEFNSASAPTGANMG